MIKSVEQSFVRRLLVFLAKAVSALLHPWLLLGLMIVWALVDIFEEDIWWKESFELTLILLVILLSTYTLKYVLRLQRPAGYSKQWFTSKYAMPSAHMVLPVFLLSGGVASLFGYFRASDLLSLFGVLVLILVLAGARLYLRASNWRDVIAGILFGVFWFVVIEFLYYLDWLPILYDSCQCGG